MSDGPVLTDDAIRELLEQRAGRVGRGEIDGRLAAVRSAAAATPQRAARRFRLVHGWAAGAAGLASLGVLVVLATVAGGWRLPAPATGASPGAATTSAAASGGPPATPVVPGAAEPVLPLTVEQLNALLATDPQSLSGRQLVISGTIGHPVPVPSCVGPLSTCEEVVVLRGSQPVLSVEPVGAAGPLLQGSVENGVTGPFAAHLVGRTLQYEGPVAVGSDGGPVLPSQLPDPGDLGLDSGYRLVRGWIAGIADPSPCPLLRNTPPPGPQYGCGLQAILSDSEYQPVTSNSFVMPPTGILVQNGAYQDFAPEPTILPASNGSGPRLTRPEQATFLVRVAPSQAVSCPPASFCPVVDLWAIQARVDPWSGPPPVSSVSPSPEPSAPSEPADGATPAVLPLTVNQLNAYMAMNSQSPAGRQLVISGTVQADQTADICLKPCTGWFLAGSNPRLWVEPGQARGSPPWTTSPLITGAFAAVLTDNFVLDYQASVSLSADGSDWLPSQLPSPTPATTTSGDWLVHAWIIGSVGGPVCPPSLAVTAPDGAQFGCGALSYLEDTNVPPGTVPLPTSPLSGLPVQNGAYSAFAPSFDAASPDPEQATFLVRTVFTGGCASCLVTPAEYHWEIVARIGPWPVPALP